MGFVDIGKVGMLRCVKNVAAHRSCEMEAVGEKGTVRLLKWEHTLSNGHIYTEYGDMFDLGIMALLYQLRGIVSWSFTSWTHLKKGDEIPICSDFEAWGHLRNKPFCEFEYLLKEPIEWVDCKGRPVKEPEDFRRKLALLCVYSHLAAGASNQCASVHDEILKVLGDYAIGSHGSPALATDFNFMMDWYEVVATAARTINNHIHTWKDYKPNKDKVGKFLDFCNANCQRMEALCVRYEYARHLWQRKEQIYNSKANDWKSAVEKVEVYRRGRFGVM